jgi:putative toxin-antitoxin system antitoxin component (TIGR02293 family)
MPQAEELFKTLGGSTVFKKHLQSTEDVRAMIHKGFPYRSLEFVLSKFHLDLPRMSRILSVPPRTMARRKAEQRLTAQESDRLARLARILSHASTVFGSEDKASTWLTRPHRVLEGTAPIELLDTDLGTQVVEAMLGRIEHGVIG